MADRLVEKIRDITLRIDSTAFDDDISETIEACKTDMKLNGIKEDKIVDTDPLILRAIKLFCKSEYADDEKEMEQFRTAYEALRNHLSLSIDYTKDSDSND